MIRVVAGIAICLTGLGLAGAALYLGWIRDLSGMEPVARQMIRTIALVFAIFAALLIVPGGVVLRRGARDRRRPGAA